MVRATVVVVTFGAVVVVTFGAVVVVTFGAVVVVTFGSVVVVVSSPGGGGGGGGSVVVVSGGGGGGGGSVVVVVVVSGGGGGGGGSVVVVVVRRVPVAGASPRSPTNARAPTPSMMTAMAPVIPNVRLIALTLPHAQWSGSLLAQPHCDRGEVGVHDHVGYPGSSRAPIRTWWTGLALRTWHTLRAWHPC